MKVKKLLNWFSYLPNKIKSLFAFIPFLAEIKKIKSAEILFFFPSYHTGGAERVHIDIVNSFQDKKTYIFFDAKSETNSNLEEFTRYSNFYEIFELINRTRFTRSMFLKILSNSINNSNNIHTLFASYSSFFYLLLPCISNTIKKIDLTHSFSLSGKGIEVTSLPYVKYLSNRIVINTKTLLDFKQLYRNNNLDIYYDKIKVIQNGVNLDNHAYPQKETNQIKICFVGRWSPEKRPKLFLTIAKKVLEKSTNFKFYFVGTDNEEHKKNIKEHNVENLGEITNKEVLISLYNEFHYICITSEREGFPMVLMEAMSYGVVPMCTNVGGISEHITNEKNGYLIDSYEDENKIVEDFLALISSEKTLRTYNDLSFNAYNYATKNFRIDKFKENYRNLILSHEK